MRILLYLIFLLSQLALSGQSSELYGQIVDVETKDPISYVNIGVVGKNIGTVSDFNGDFWLNVGSKYAKDTLRISIIGYEAVNMPVYKIHEQLNQSQKLELKQRNLEIPEIVVVDNSLNSRILGNKKPTPNFSVGFSTDTLGNEMAIRCKVKRKRSHLKKLNVHIAANPYDTLRFRVNIYDTKKGKPNEIINLAPIYTTSTIQEGIHVVDLSPFNIITSRDFFISIEWIEDLTKYVKHDESGLNFAGSLFGKPVYHRTTSHGVWRKINGLGITMNVEVLQ